MKLLQHDGAARAREVDVGVPVVGKTVVDFGAAGALTASVLVSGQLSILSSSVADAGILAAATSDHTVDEHLFEDIRISCSTPVAAVGFTIHAVSGTTKLYGKYSVRWSWA